MEMPFQRQINKEVVMLTTLKKAVPRAGALGEDNHAMIDAQINVLKNNLNFDQTYALYIGNKTDNYKEACLYAAMCALRWADGEQEESPSSQWRKLVSK